LRRTSPIPDLPKHFLHKGKRMHEGSREISPRIVGQRSEVHNQVMDQLAASVKDLHPNRILDVGTGYGINVGFLTRRFGKRSRIWSIDASPAVVREIKGVMRKHRYSRHVVVKVANAERLPFKNGNFELVVSLFSLHHLSNPKRGLFEMNRVLSSGGKLVIADWRPTAAKPLMLHAWSDMPSPTFVTRELKRLGDHARSHVGRYWYLTESVKREKTKNDS